MYYRYNNKLTLIKYFVEAATLHILREKEFILEEGKESEVIENKEPYFSFCSYMAETNQAMDVVEGERVYILEDDNPDWWFVKKHLTGEKGWVPARYLMDELNYEIYLQKKLNEKIDKLPIFESK